MPPEIAFRFAVADGKRRFYGWNQSEEMVLSKGVAMNAQPAHDRSNRDIALKALYDDLYAKNMFPFWATSADVDHDEIKQLMGSAKANPFVWSYAEDIEPILRRAAGSSLWTISNAARSSWSIRAGAKPATVTTMYTAYRLNDPNEIMPPHRHSPSAVRFGLTGSGNFTGVDVESIASSAGGMVLTPNDTWHNHGTVGDEPAVILFVLDLPLVEHLNAILSSTITARPWRRKATGEGSDGALSVRLLAAHLHSGVLPRFVRAAIRLDAVVCRPWLLEMTRSPRRSIRTGRRSPTKR